MTLIVRLNSWRARSVISEGQYRELLALVRRDIFSVFFELNALLYLGVFAFIGGLGWTVKVYFAQLGDPAILAGLTVLFAACLAYCYQKGLPFSRSETVSPTFIFDYVLYLGCLVFSVELSYLEMRYHLLAAHWDVYLLISAFLFFVFAYRFDNRFVLSLALSTLAAWFGIKISHYYLYDQAVLRPYAIAYGFCVGIAGTALAQAGVKRHFLDTYLQIAANVLLMATLSGVIQTRVVLWPCLLFFLAGAAITYGVRTRQFSFVTYAILYSYVDINILIHRAVGWTPWMSFYYLISGGLVIGMLIGLSRRFGGES